MLNLIKKYASGRNVILLMIAANTVYLLMIFVTIPQVMVFSGGMKLFDMMPSGYGLTYARTLLETLGSEGRTLYLTRQLPLDMLYPGLSGMAYSLLMCWLFIKLNLTGKRIMYLCLVPLFAGLFDYLENFGIITMIATFPVISGFQVAIACTFSVVKSMLSALFFMILIVAFTVFLYRKF